MAPGGDHGRCGTGLLGQRERRLAGGRAGRAALRRGAAAPRIASAGRAAVPLERPIQTGVVSPGCVYRSGQPKERGFEWLKEQGSAGWSTCEENPDLDAAAVRKHGFHYLYLPSGTTSRRRRSRPRPFCASPAIPTTGRCCSTAAPGQGRAAVSRRWFASRSTGGQSGAPSAKRGSTPALLAAQQQAEPLPARLGPKPRAGLRAPRSRHGGDEPGRSADD